MKRRLDFDRDRRPELRGLAEKALTLAKELHETRLREEVVPPLEEVARAMERRKEKEVEA